MSNVTGYRFLQLIDGAGSDIAVDSDDPNTAEPPDSRIAHLPKGTTPPTIANGFVFHLLSGSSIKVQIWVLEESTGTWVKGNASVTTITASPTVVTTAGLALPWDARVFMQVTENAGNVTQLGWHYG